MNFPAEANALVHARGYIKQWIEKNSDHSLEWQNDVVIAAGEVLQNIIRHGRYVLPRKQTYSLRLTKGCDDFVFLFIKDGALPLVSTDFLRAHQEPSENGGMGLQIVHAISRNYRIVPRRNGNLHLLQF